VSERYDAVVVGVGGMGSAATYRLAERGLDVLGLERYDVPHARGSSHGKSRIVRLTQPEAPSYVPLAQAALENWRALEATTGRDLLTVTGSVHAGHPDADVVEDARRSLDAHDVRYELLDGEDVSGRFPGYDLPADYRAVYQPDGGFVDPERAICAHVDAAHAEGATVRARERVTDWRASADGVVVDTDKDRYEADDLVVTAGAWNGDLVPALAEHLTPIRAVMAWLQPERPADFQPDSFPVFVVEGREGDAYGFPVYDVPGFKLGVDPESERSLDPDTLGEPTYDDERRHRAFAEAYFPAAAGPTLRLSTCMYTESTDGHFLVGPHPEFEGVTVAAGFTGHGFKFTSVVGEVLADLVVDGHTDHRLDRHRIGRLDAA